MINNEKIINSFCKTINKTAPLGDGYFYPYKPALIISILKNFAPNEIFNKPINLDNDDILKIYYDLLVSDVVLFDKLNKQKSKQSFNVYTGFNFELKKLLLKNIFEMPAKKLVIKENEFWLYNKSDKTVFINIDADEKQLNEYYKIILKTAVDTYKKCVPSAKDLNFGSMNCYDEVVELVINSDNPTKKYSLIEQRQHQHTFAKMVKDRDKKCIICCETEPCLLQAAHIKPYKDCINAIESYDLNNGITLCANHHKLFDNYFFTFNIDWTIKVKEKFKNEDSYLAFKSFEPCYSMLQYSKPSYENEYLKYRNRQFDSK